MLFLETNEKSLGQIRVQGMLKKDGDAEFTRPLFCDGAACVSRRESVL